MGRIIHVELTNADPDGSAAFFAAAFGWRTTPSPLLPGYLVASTGPGPGIDGAIMSSDHRQQPVIAWLQTDDIAGSLSAVAAAGGSLTSELHDLPGEGKVAYFTDPSGVLHGLKQPPAR